jgi:hypothetical protein
MPAMPSDPPRSAWRRTEDALSDQPDSDQAPVVELNTNVAHPARVYDYWLGGKDNFPADAAAAEQAMEALPQVVDGARANRAFLRRAVRYLASEAGIRQFLDIGTGIPTSPNVHEIARASRRSRASSTSTTTRSCWCTPARC